MMTRRDFIQTAAVAGAATSLAGCATAGNAASLQWQHFPETFDGPALTLEGHPIEIVKAQGLDNRRYLWVPSTKSWPRPSTATR